MSLFLRNFEDIYSKLLFIDIETVSNVGKWNELSDEMKSLWEVKATQLQRYADEKIVAEQMYEERAGIFSEFGKIVCISLGYIQQSDNENYTLSIKSISDDNEKDLLIQFFNIVEKFEHKAKSMAFLGHNIKEFDLPYICRRSLIHGLSLPKALQLSGLKPWEINHLDTLELWRFGDYKHYISLALMAHIFGIESPKDALNGSQVSHAYWHENRLKDITDYCNKDVITVAKIFMKLKNVNSTLTINYKN